VTAFPVEEDPAALLLICDDCGRRFDNRSADEWVVLWHRAVMKGWAGRGRAIGPHRCDSCAV
jgi:hypothetical protein